MYKNNRAGRIQLSNVIILSCHCRLLTDNQITVSYIIITFSLVLYYASFAILLVNCDYLSMKDMSKLICFNTEKLWPIR